MKRHGRDTSSSGSDNSTERHSKRKSSRKDGESKRLRRLEDQFSSFLGVMSQLIEKMESHTADSASIVSRNTESSIPVQLLLKPKLPKYVWTAEGFIFVRSTPFSRYIFV